MEKSNKADQNVQREKLDILNLLILWKLSFLAERNL